MKCKNCKKTYSLETFEDEGECLECGKPLREDNFLEVNPYNIFFGSIFGIVCIYWLIKSFINIEWFDLIWQENPILLRFVLSVFSILSFIPLLRHLLKKNHET